MVKTVIVSLVLYWWAPVGVAYAIIRWLRWRRIRRAVFANLDSAAEDGQFEPDGYLHGYTSFDVAADLEVYAEDCSGYTAEQMFPHVRAWMRGSPTA